MFCKYRWRSKNWKSTPLSIFKLIAPNSRIISYNENVSQNKQFLSAALKKDIRIIHCRADMQSNKIDNNPEALQSTSEKLQSMLKTGTIVTPNYVEYSIEQLQELVKANKFSNLHSRVILNV